MSLIDGDALTKKLVEFCNKNCPYTAKERNVMCGSCFMGLALESVDDAPTIEPQRKKGEWIPEFNGKFTGGAYWFSCSKCKRIVPKVRNGGWNFCPNCGADMRDDDIPIEYFESGGK